MSKAPQSPKVVDAPEVVAAEHAPVECYELDLDGAEAETLSLKHDNLLGRLRYSINSLLDQYDMCDGVITTRYTKKTYKAEIVGKKLIITSA
ncbi:MAG: hypothetical protein ACRCV9_12390 [Burkholderiaceae bacterium]